jgi:uncharacterized hydrophobic protein (TIGR00271 family)
VPAIIDADLVRMRSDLLFDGPERGRKLSRFWALLLLAAVIATSGVISDSTATVIGAMIVALLMTPILGTVLSIVTADIGNLVRSVLLVVGGAVAVVLVGWLIGQLIPYPVVAATNSQVAARVHPHTIDLIAALATGAVGSFALVRSDISDTLPGVAIAISLVPPLAVVGLTLESGRPHQAAGAALLFVTNVVAILLSGLVVMALYRVRVVAMREPAQSRLSSRAATVFVVAAVIALLIPLVATSQRITIEAVDLANVAPVAKTWAKKQGWEIVTVDSDAGGVLVRATGPLPIPDPHSLRSALDAHGLKGVGVQLELVPSERTYLPGS